MNYEIHFKSSMQFVYSDVWGYYTQFYNIESGRVDNKYISREILKKRLRECWKFTVYKCNGKELISKTYEKKNGRFILVDRYIGRK